MQEKYLAALNLSPAMPEILLAIGAMVLLMIGVFSREKSTVTITGLAIALLIVAGVFVFNGSNETISTFDGAFIVDPFANYMKILTLIGSIAAIAMSIAFIRREKFDHFEYPI
ncbi:MAG: NADH-quinone oxidoreductase subunit N, partial [Hyphomicrobiales bacterium]